MKRLDRLVMGICFIEVLICVVLGVAGYYSIRSTHNDELAIELSRDSRNIAAIVNRLAPDQDIATLLGQVEMYQPLVWNHFSDADIQILSAESTILLDTREPHHVGDPAASMRASVEGSGGPEHFSELMKPGAEWIGPYECSTGEAQIIAYTYAEDASMLVAVKIPQESVTRHVLTSYRPVIVGIAILALILIPASMLVVHTMYRRSEGFAANQLIALEKSRRKYTAIVEAEPECVKLLDADGRILEMNPAGLKLIGVKSLEEIKGRSVYDLISPQYHDAYRKLHSDIFRGIPGTLEYEIIRPSGENRMVHTSAVPMHDTDGVISAHLAITRDTTDQRKITRQLELTQFAVDNSSVSTFWIRRNGSFAYVNDAACRILGYSQEELLGMSVSDIDPVFPVDVWPEHWLEMKNAGAMTFEALHQAKDGRVYPVEITTNYLHFEDEEYIWAYSTDISEKKQAQNDLLNREAKLQAIVDTAAEGIVTIDEQGIIQSFNRAAENIFGYAADEIIGRNISLLMPEPLASEHDEYLKNYLQTGRAKIIGVGREVFALRKDGSTIPIGVAVSETYIGDTRMFTGLCRDISERVEMERERQLLETQLLQAQKIEAVGTLATGVAHDISNSLTAILGYTSILREKYTDDHDLIETISGIELASNMSLEVAQSLLTFSRKGGIEKDRINLVEITTEISNLLKRLLPSSIQLYISVDHESDPIWINGNAQQIQRVLVNLSVNARDAMPEGGSLSISFDRVCHLPPELAQMVESAQSEYVCIEVSDTGVGMNSKTLASIYDPFFTTKARGQGTGLGMSIVHGIISDHHGLINIESAPGEGTQVSLYLPLLPVALSLS